MGHIMHDTMHPDGKTPLKFIKELLKLMEMILNAQAFCSYYFKVGAKMQNVGDGESESTIQRPRY